MARSPSLGLLYYLQLSVRLYVKMLCKADAVLNFSPSIAACLKASFRTALLAPGP